jgi:pentatricopeptide repeat protein
LTPPISPFGTLISGYAQNGLTGTDISLFHEMMMTEFSPQYFQLVLNYDFYLFENGSIS